MNLIADLSDIRNHNIRLILNTIRSAGAISRADVARDTLLSRSTVTNVVNDLLPTGLIRESGTGSSVVGRRPIMLEFVPEARAVLGVDMGATHLTVVALNLGGETLAIRREDFPVATKPDQSVARILTLLDEVDREAGYPRQQVLGVGIGVPAPLEGERLDRISGSILPYWTGIDVKREVAAALGLSVFLDNDANLGALAEKWWGHGREVQNLAYIKVATGVGCGLIINGAIFRGEGGTAGEIGHTSIVPDGPRCRCGLQGCLEALTGEAAILQTVRERAKGKQGSTLDREDLTLDNVIEAAQENNPVAVDIIREVGRYLGIAVANLLNLVNPGLIVLGGDITKAGNLLLAELRGTVRAHSFAKSNAEATITTSRLGDDAVAIGAATLVIEHLLHSPDTSILDLMLSNGRR